MKKIILCPFYYQKSLLSKLRKENQFFDVKFIDKETILRCYFGQFKSEAISYLIKKYDLSYILAKTFLRYLPYLNENVDDEKSIRLNEIKNNLIKNDFYKKDEYTLNLIKNNDVEIYGYSNKDHIFNKILEKLNVTYTYIIEGEVKENDLITYDTHEQEVHAMMIKICDLLSSGVDINDIFVFGVSQDYEDMIKRYQTLYDIPFNGFAGLDLLKFEFSKDFFKLYYENHNIDASFIEIDDIYKDDANYKTFKDSVIKLKDDDLDFVKQYDVLKNGLKASVESPVYDKAVTILKDCAYLEDKYIFVLGFAQGSYPSVKADNEYLEDEIKAKHNILTSKQENAIAKHELLMFLKSNNNFYYSFSNKVFFNVKYISFLKDDLKLNVINGDIPEYDYAKKAAQIQLLQLKDLRYKYKEQKPELNAYSKVCDFKYRDFDNQFKPFKAIEENKDIYYSYSSFKKYIGCPFAYYLDKVLTVDDFETTFSAKLGTAFHAVLQDGVNDPKANFEDLYNTHFNDEFDAKEKLLCDNMKEHIELALKTCRDQLLRVRNPRVELEKKLLIKLDEHSFLLGYIDKMIIADNKYAAIIDYKTGSKESFDDQYLQYGKNMQLPTYTLLMSEDENFKKYEVGGLYINYVVPTGKKEKEMETGAPKYLRLAGKSLASQEYLTAMEPGYPDHDVRYIDLKPKKDTSSFPKKATFTVEDRKNYIQTCKDIYKQCDKAIRNDKFSISPMQLKSDFACTFCPYADICFVKNDQIRVVNVEKEAKDGD